MTREKTMRSVLRSYIPLFVWLLLAALALTPSLAGAVEGEYAGVESQLRLAHDLVANERWAEVARIKLAPAGAPIWAAFPATEGELVYARGLGAARGGYRAMAWHAIERLELVRSRAQAEGNGPCAERAAFLQAALRRELD